MAVLVDPIRYGAFVKMLTSADPSDLPARGHRWTQPGDPNRLATHLPKIVMAWVQTRLVGRELDATAGSAMKAKRRRLRPSEHHVLTMHARSVSSA